MNPEVKLTLSWPCTQHKVTCALTWTSKRRLFRWRTGSVLQLADRHIA